MKNKITRHFFLEDYQKRINQKLANLLSKASLEPNQLHEAMRYVVLNGGKRLRPILVYATGLTLGAHLDALDTPAIAIELIHCYSLVHDDLPAMDNDDTRRGKPTCHIAYDEATAILVGDALQSMAFEILAEPNKLIKPHLRLQMIQLLAHLSGSMGMAGGQSLDLAAIPKSSKMIETIHTLKTAALFSASIQMGALTAGQDNPLILNSLDELAKVLGVAFQIQDDLADLAEIEQKNSKNQTSYLLVNDKQEALMKIEALYKEANLIVTKTIGNQNHPLSEVIKKLAQQ